MVGPIHNIDINQALTEECKAMNKRAWRKWEDYHNDQKYSECQLVSVLNAYYYLTGKKIEQDSQEYEDLVDICGARYGSAISIQDVREKLGLEIKELMFSPTMDSEGNKKQIKLPLEASVWHKSVGFHSVVVVDYEPITDSYRIPNFKGATNSQGWIYGEDLRHFLEVGVGDSMRSSCANCDDSDKRWQFRLYGVRNEQ